MERIPEPELMNDPSQVAAYAGPALDNGYWLFVQRFRKYFPDLAKEGAVLDLGCGPSAIPIRLAKLLPGWQIHGVDGSAVMLAAGRDAVRREGLENRIRLLHGVLPEELPLPRTYYDAVISNSFLHHLADPMVLWQAIRRYGRQGAGVLVMDLLRPTDRDAAEAVVDAYVPEAPPMLRQDMLLSLAASYTLEEIAIQLELAGLADCLSLSMASPVQFAVYGSLECKM
jgi:ubiquinone/menaquinone biosynthesis C-methylase UbiE